jgi:hypothetical protein
MVTVEIGIRKRFRGLSTETKPTTGLSVGDEWIEVDTGVVYIWDGGAWKSVGAGLGIVGVISLE